MAITILYVPSIRLFPLLSLLTSSRNAWIDVLRALAASWVVLFHLAEGQHIPKLLSLMPKALTYVLFEKGHLGVAMFFVVSGYVMAMTQSRPVVSLGQANRFVARRLVRLWPPYMFALVLTVLSLLVKARLDATSNALPSLSSLLAHVFFLQDLLGFTPINLIFWTLCIEIQFYIVFAMVVCLSDRYLASSHRHGLYCTRFWVLCAFFFVSVLWPLGLLNVPATPGLFLPLFYSFLLGSIVQTFTTLPASKKFESAAIFIALSLVFLSTFRLGASFALASAATALLLYASGSQWLTGVVQSRALAVLASVGTFSYSLYLLHNLTIGLAFRVTKRFLGDSLVAQLFGAALALSTALAVAWISYRLVEKPAIRWSRVFR